MRVRYLLILMMLWVASPAHAESLTLDEALALAGQKDPMLEQTLSKAQALDEKSVSDAQLPDPKVTLGLDNYPTGGEGFMRVVVPVTLMIIVLLLYLNFMSFAEVAIIIGTLPLALIGGFWLLYLLGYNMSVAVTVGFIALAGVAVEIGVLLLVYLNQSLKHHRDKAVSENRDFSIDDLRNAVIEGALMRIRPIFMTVVTIFAGLVTVMLGGGTGSEVMRRIAAPMVGGSISATVLILLVIPAIFILWKQASLKLKKEAAHEQ